MGVECSVGPMIRSQAFIVPMPLDCELLKSFSVVFFSSLLRRQDGCSKLEFDICLLPGYLGSDNFPTG